MSKSTGLCKRCWALNRKHKPESLIKMSETKKKLWKNKEYWLKSSQAQKKRFSNPQNHPNWKGGITPKSKLERQSARYTHFRMDILKRDDFICQICFKRGGRLEIDHIMQWALYPNERYNPDNVRTLCHDCHVLTPSYKKVVKDA